MRRQHGLDAAALAARGPRRCVVGAPRREREPISFPSYCRAATRRTTSAGHRAATCEPLDAAGPCRSSWSSCRTPAPTRTRRRSPSSPAGDPPRPRGRRTRAAAGACRCAPDSTRPAAACSCYTNSARTDPATLPRCSRCTSQARACVVKVRRENRGAPLREIGSLALQPRGAALLRHPRPRRERHAEDVLARRIRAAAALTRRRRPARPGADGQAPRRGRPGRRDAGARLPAPRREVEHQAWPARSGMYAGRRCGCGGTLAQWRARPRTRAAGARRRCWAHHHASSATRTRSSSQWRMPAERRSAAAARTGARAPGGTRSTGPASRCSSRASTSTS